MRECACCTSYLRTCLLRTWLVLTALLQTAGGCSKPCSCHVPKEVHCTFRYLTAVPDHIQTAVERLNLGYNSITVLKENDLIGLENLELLMLHSNTIHSIEDRTFQDLKSLQVLKMSYNKIKTINKTTFKGLESLLRLQLDHNHLEFISPEAFYGLTKLQSVNLEGNYLQQIHPDTFITMRYSQLFKVSSVKSIHLSDNLLSSLPADIFPSSSQLENLFLHGNPWSCDCNMEWFPKWMQRNTGVLKCKRDRRYPKGQLCPLCENPSIYHNSPISLLPSDGFTCTKPWIQPHLKHKNISLDEGEFTPVSPKDFIAPLGSMQLNLTDHFHNDGSLSCIVQRPSAFENLTLALEEEGGNNVTVLTAEMTAYLICNIEHEHIQQLWQILAMYSDSPVRLRRGLMLAKSPEMIYRYSQVKPKDEEDGIHTNIEAVIKAMPALLMQGEINLQLDRTATTFSTLYVKYQSVVNLRVENTQTNRNGYTWTMIKRDNKTKTQHTAVTGGVAQFSCQVIGEPKPLIEWILPDGNKLRAPYSSEDKRILITAEGTFTLRGAGATDTGLYRCIATNYLDADILVFRLTVLSPDVEETEINGLQLSKSLGEKLFLECGSSGSPKPSVSWILPDNTVLETWQGNREVYENGSLLIQGLTKRDRGFYRCLVSNHLGFDLLVSQVLLNGEKNGEKTIWDREQSEIEIQALKDNDKRNIEKSFSNAYEKISQESRTITSDRPYPRLRSQDRGHSSGRLGQRRRGSFSNRHMWSNRVFDKSYRKVDPQRFAEFMKNVKNGARTATGTKIENAKHYDSNIFSGDGEISSGENPDNIILPRIIKPVTIKPEFDSRWTETNLAATEINRPISNNDTYFKLSTEKFNTRTTESYLQHKPINQSTQKNSFTLKQEDIQESQGDAVTPHVTALQNTQFSTFNEATEVYSLERTSNSVFNRHPVTPQLTVTDIQQETQLQFSGQHPGDPETFTEAALSFTTDPHVTPLRDGTGSLAYTSRDPESQTTFSAVTTTEKQQDGITFHTTQTIKSPRLHSGSTIISRQQIHIIPHKNSRGGRRRGTIQGRRRIIKPSRITDIQSFITKLKQTTVNKEGNATAPYKIELTTDRDCDKDKMRTTTSPAEQRTIALKVPTHSEPRELVSKGYITTADPVLITVEESSVPTTYTTGVSKVIHGRIPWNRLLERENISSRPKKPSITPKISTTAETTTVTPTTTSAAVPTIRPNVIAVPDTVSHSTHSQTKESSGDDYGDFSADFEFSTPKPRFNYQTYTTPTYYSRSSTTAQTLAESQTLPSPPTVKPSISKTQDEHIISGSGGLPDQWLVTRQKPTRAKGRHGRRKRPFRGRKPTKFDPRETTVRTTIPPRGTPSVSKPFYTSSRTADRSSATINTHQTSEERMFTSGSSAVFTTTQTPIITSSRIYPTTTFMPTTAKILYTTAWNRVYSNITPTQRSTTNRPHIRRTRPTIKSSNRLTGEQVHTNTHVPYLNKETHYAISHVHHPVTSGYDATSGTTARFESTSNVVMRKPKVVGGNAASFTVLSDSDAFLPCEAMGNPVPTISWKRLSSDTGNTIAIMSKIGKFEVLSNGTLMIQNANIKDRGQYLCLAENIHGSDRLLVTLSVVAYPSRILEPKMRELKSHAGNRVEIKCKAEGRPTPIISWILANRTQVRGQNTEGRVTVTDEGTLVIEQVSVYDRGHYKCIASNPAGADTATVRLQVVAAPPGILEEKRQQVKIFANKNIYLPCTGHGSPQPNIHWVLRDGSVLQTNKWTRASRISVYQNGTLHIKDLMLSDSGKYECIATSSTGSERRVVTLIVERHESMPQIIEISQRLSELFFGDQLRLNCTAEGDPKPRIIWRLPSKAVVDHWHRMGSRIQVLENGTLIINSVSDKDAGEYLCVARNTIGDDLQLLRVTVSMKPAKIEAKLYDKKQVPYGKELKVDCKASGAPKPEISWGLPDGTVVNSVYQSDASSGGGRARRYTLFDNGTLYLNQVGMSEDGDYTCYAENQVGKDEMHVRITVITAAPRIHFPAQTYARVKPGGNVRLDCEAVGEPKPKILWMLPTKDVIAASYDHYLVHVNGSLDIRDVKLIDVGEYTCMARNPAGENRKIYKVEIDGNPPVINGYHQNRTVVKDVAAKYSQKLLHCKAEGDPIPTVTWIMPDNIFLSAPYFGSRINVHHNGTLEIKHVRPTDTAEFICMARNDGGEAVMVVQLEVTGMLQRPIFRNPFNERIVSQIGKTVVLNCSASGHPIPEIYWTLPNGTRFNQGQGHSSRHQLSSDGSLVIYSPRKEDTGKYRCGAKNYMGYIERLVLLEVGQKPYILTRPRGIIHSVSGESLFLHCLSDGNPRPKIYWTIPGGHTLARPQVLGRYQLLENGTLIIQDTTVHDRGSYICQAQNNAGKAVLTVPVVIAYPPRITTGPLPTIRANRGTPIYLNCVAIGIPTPEITWELPDRSLLSAADQGRSTGSELLHPQGTLIIQRPTVSDSGTYKCLAKNYLGTDSKATYVHVL